VSATNTLIDPGRIDVTPSSPLENVTIAGEYHIVQRGGRVENVGFDGGKPTNSDWVVRCEEGQSATIRHVYGGDGDANTGGDPHAFIFVQAGHAGDLILSEVNVQGYLDNGVYASAPGNGQSWPNKIPGGGGTVRIENSYGGNCVSAVFRLGTTGSTCRGCVIDDTAAGGSSDRACWSYTERTGWENVRARVGGTVMQVSTGVWGDRKGSTAVVNNSSYDGGAPTLSTNGSITGDGWLQDTVSTASSDVSGVEVVALDDADSDDPNDQLVYQQVYDPAEEQYYTLALDLRPPTGVPMSAAEAENGTSTAEGTIVPPGSPPTDDGTTPTTVQGGFAPAECEVVEYSAAISATDPNAIDGGFTTGGGSGPVPAGAGDIGGGAGYTDILSATDADTVVPADDGPAAARAIGNASSGETIFLEGGNYQFDRASLTSDNVTIAGNRGATTTASLITDGGSGALGPTVVAGGPEGRPIRVKASGCRITGLRFEGPDTTWNGEAGSNDHHPVGVEHRGGTALTIDNCEAYGWEAVAFAMRGDGPGTVAYSYIHDNPGASQGYGVASSPSSGRTLIVKNYFANNRHSIAANPSNAGYEVIDNIFAPAYYNHALDQHGPDPAGGKLIVRYNTFTVPGKAQCIRIRGRPRETAEFTNNLFYTSDRDYAVQQTGEIKLGQKNKYSNTAANPESFVNMIFDQSNVFGQQSAPNAGARTGGETTTQSFGRQVA